MRLRGRETISATSRASIREKIRTAGEEEMEKPLARIGGSKSRMYSGGTLAARNSYMTSLMVRRGRLVYSMRSSYGCKRNQLC